MKTLIRFSTVKIRFLFHSFTSRNSLYAWHKVHYVFLQELQYWSIELQMYTVTIPKHSHL